jgi:hypothetical protein
MFNNYLTGAILNMLYPNYLFTALMCCGLKPVVETSTKEESAGAYEARLLADGFTKLDTGGSIKK